MSPHSSSGNMHQFAHYCPDPVRQTGYRESLKLPGHDLYISRKVFLGRRTAV